MAQKSPYDNIDPEAYEKRRGDNRKEKYQYDYWAPAVAAAIGRYSRDAVVLDLGCGPGNYSFEMKKYAKEVFGVDSSARMLEYATKKYPGIHFMNADATQTPFAQNEMDAVFCFGLFEYADKEKLMKEIYRVLKPGGVSVILAPNAHSIPRFPFRVFHTIIGKKRKCDEPSFKQMMGLFRDFGFKVISYKMDDGLFWLPYNLDMFFGRKAYVFVEHCFKFFKRNPLSTNMLFIVKK